MSKHFSAYLYMAILVFSFNLNCLNAQVPGYQGKKFLLSYNAQFSPNINDVIFLEVPFRLHTKHVIEADYVIDRRITAGLNIGFMMHKHPYSYTYRSDVTEYRNSDLKINGFAVGGNFKFYGPFTNNTLAPLGSYLNLSAQYLHYNLLDEAGAFRESSADSTTKAYETSSSGAMVGLGFGTRRIYYDKVCIDFGISSNLAVVFPDEVYNKNADLSGDYLTVFAFRRHLLMYHIGIGGLLF